MNFVPRTKDIMGLHEKTVRRDPINDRETVLTFGKYKGFSIDDVMDAEPQYLVWLHHNNDYFELDADLLDEAEGYSTNRNNNWNGE